MDLICAAYRGEAKSWLSGPRTKTQKLEKISTRPELFYSPGQYAVLITGEGRQRATQSLMQACSLLKDKNKELNRIVSVGCAGALSSQLAVGTTHEIRTVYAQQKDQRMERVSFSSPSPDAKMDCVSALARVRDTSEKSFLANFADCVDLELWSIASVAKWLNLKFVSIKYISDLADESLNCNLVREDADAISASLFQFYTEHLSPEKQGLPPSHTPKDNPLDLWQDQPIKLSQSMLQKANKLLDVLSQKKQLAKIKIIQELATMLPSASDRSPKDLGKLWIAEMERLARPHESRLLKQFNQWTNDLPGTHLRKFHSWEPDLETGALRLNAKLRNQKEVDQLAQHLKDLPVEKVLRLLDGDTF